MEQALEANLLAVEGMLRVSRAEQPLIISPEDVSFDKSNLLMSKLLSFEQL